MKKFALTMLSVLAMAFVFAGCGSDKDGKDYLAQDYVVVASNAAVRAGEAITENDYKGLSVDCSVTTDEIQSELDTFASDNKYTNKITNRKCKNGETVNIDFAGKVGGKSFDGGTSNSYSLTLGSGSMIDGFESGIVGMKAGAKKTLSLQFPSDYSTSSLAGKKVKFTIKLNYIEEEITPKVDDQLIADKTDYKTVDEWKAAKEKELIQNKKDSAGEDVLQQLMSNLETTTYPENLMSDGKKQVEAMYTMYAQYYGMDLDTFITQMGMDETKYNQNVESAAKSYVTQQLIVEAIAEMEGIKKSDITEDELKTQTNEMITSYGVSDEDTLKTTLKQYTGLDDTDAYIKNVILTDKVVAALTKYAKCTVSGSAVSASTGSSVDANALAGN